MSRRAMGNALVILGVVIGLFSALADKIRVGEGTEFGPNQLAGTIGGAVILLIGLVLVLTPTKRA